MSEVYDLRKGQENLSDWFKYCLKLHLLLKCVYAHKGQWTLMKVSSFQPHRGSCADSGLSVATSLLNQHTACVWLILETKSHCITQTGLELMTSCLSLLNAGFQDSINPHWERLLPFALPLCLLDRSLTAQSCGLLLTKLDWERAEMTEKCCHSPEEKCKPYLHTLWTCFGLPVPVRQHRKHVLPWASEESGTQTLCWGIWESAASWASS